MQNLPTFDVCIITGVTCQNWKWPNMSSPVFSCFGACLSRYRGRGRHIAGLETSMLALLIIVCT